MKNFYKVLFVLVSSISLMSCASSNIKRFNPEVVHKDRVEKNITQKVKVDVTMPAGNRDSIMCRMAGNIYLPNKMTYSEYIDDALKRVLRSTNRLSEAGDAPRLSVILTKVDFSSTSGKWYIDANVKINNNHFTVKNVTNFGTSWDAMSACRNVANSFDEAVANFAEEVLSNPNLRF